MNDLELAQYQEGLVGAGFGEVADLLKAMQAGQITGRDTSNQLLTMEPLKTESLETTLKLLDFRLQDIRLINDIPKLPAYNTVEEYLQLVSYGADRGGFYPEGALSDVEDSQYMRKSEKIKYIQVTGEVTLQAQMVRSFYDAMRKEIENKIMWVMRRANSALTKADEDLINLEFNSLYKQHASIGTGDGFQYADLETYFTSPVVVDMRGKSIKQKDIENGSIIVDDNFGYPTDFYSPPTVVSALAQDYFKDQRILQEGSAMTGVIGTAPTAIGTSINPKLNLKTDKFMKAGLKKKLATAATTTKAPAQPTAGTVPANAADSVSKITAGEVGTVYYAVTGINGYGESALRLLDSTVILTATGFSIDLTFTDGGGPAAASAYQIYRTKVTAAATATDEFFYPLFKVSAAQLTAGYDGGAAGKIRDRHRIMPDMEQAFMTQMDEEVLSLKQLAPVSKLDLAVTALSRRFVTFNFCTPNLYAIKKMVRFINCSKILTA